MPESTDRERVLVLGAGGFIGRQVVRALAAGDWATPIAAVHRTVLRADEPLQSVQLDARDAAALKRALVNVSAVVNCVAGDAGTIVAGAQALFDTCSAFSSPPRIVNMSTMMVYGTATGSLDETAPLRGDWNAYSAAKAEVEKLSRGYPSVVHLRPGIVYGPDSPIWSERVGRWLCEQRLGDLGAAGLGNCNLVHIQDVVQAIVRCLRLRGIEGHAFNLSLPSPLTWNDYFRQFAAALGTPYASISRARLYTELYLLGPPLKLAEIASGKLHLNRSPPAPIRPWLLRLCAHPIRLEVQKAERLLGMQWTPLESGLLQSASLVLTARNA